MKRILLFSICYLLFSTFVYSQKMVEENKTWHIYQGYFVANGVQAYTNIFKFQDSIELNNQVYLKLWSTTDSTLQNFVETQSAFREDSLGRVYLKFLNFSTPTEHLFYDFSLMKGDTFTTTLFDAYVVHDVDTVITLDGLPRKRMLMRPILDDSIEPWLTSWVKGIGGEGGTFEPGFAFILDAFDQLTCYHENESLVYNGTAIGTPTDECYKVVVGTTNLISIKNINFSPNPTNNWLEIKGLEQINESCQLEIFNLAGQQVFKKNLQNISTQQLTFDLNNGLYFYKISREDSLLKTGKLMIKR